MDRENLPQQNNENQPRLITIFSWIAKGISLVLIVVIIFLAIVVYDKSYVDFFSFSKNEISEVEPIGQLEKTSLIDELSDRRPQISEADKKLMIQSLSRNSAKEIPRSERVINFNTEL